MKVTSANSNVSASQLSYAYKLTTGESLAVLQDISLTVERGSFTSIVGPSGCGKTTLLLCISGLLAPTKGSVALDGLSPTIAREQHKIGYVFQKPVFFEWLSILENTLLPAKVAGVANGVDRARLLLDRFGLGGFAERYPHELSGGMLSRAALARALVHDPEYVFLDEAFNHLDEALREQINEMLQEIWLDRKMTVFAITHSISEAVFLADQVLVMSQKPSFVQLHRNIPFERPRPRSLLRDQRYLELVDEIRDALKATHTNET